MKPKLLLSLLFTFVFYLLSSQVPQGFNYQAIARNASGDAITNTSLPVRITIQSDSLGGTTFWIEEHLSVTTNSFGLFTVIIGKGVKKIGSTANTFNDIDWSVAPKFIKTEIDYSGWKNMGSSRLWTVPYAMVTAKADSAKALLKGSKLAVVSSNDLSTDALFEVKRKDGQTVFAVYPDAVNIYVPRTAKGTKGGFAIGGFETAKLGPQDYFRVTPDSVRIYIDKTPTIAKGATKGGFAIGGFDQVKAGGGIQDFFTVGNDSIRMYINDLPGKSSTKGGFAIGGFEQAKGTKYNYLKVEETKIKGGKTDFMKLSGLNTFIGDSAGFKNVPSGDNGSYNNFIGYKSGYSNTSGHHNTYIGWKSGYNVGPNAHYNIYIGNLSGYNNTGSSNIFIGDNSGYRNTSGTQNVFIGALAGKMNKTGNNNMFIGSGAGRRDSSGGNNTFLGTAAGEYNILSSNNTYIGWLAGGSNDNSANVMIGTEAGLYATSVANNVFLGYRAGYNSSAGASGSNSVFIGNKAGYYETISNKLFIDNTSRASEADARIKALVYGVFGTNPVDQRFTINAVMKLTPMADPPVPAEEGMIYADTDHFLYYYNGSNWMKLF